jgi:hypothetical protein
MARTVPNVTGDLLTSLVVARSERLPLEVPALDFGTAPVPASLELAEEEAFVS